MTAPAATPPSARSMRPWTWSAPGLATWPGLDAASLPAVTQARLLRELERAEPQHTAARARVLTAFTVQGGLRR